MNMHMHSTLKYDIVKLPNTYFVGYSIYISIEARVNSVKNGFYCQNNFFKIEAVMLHNKGILAFFIYYFATHINDVIIVKYGAIGIATPRQFAVIIGIIIAAPYIKIRNNTYFFKSILWLIVFYFVGVFSLLYYYSFKTINENFINLIFSSGLNILWLFVVGNIFSQGLTRGEKHKIIWGILILGLIPLFSGLYELIHRGYIIRSGFSEYFIGGFPYVRGFHIDKVDYVCSLAPSAILSLCLFLKEQAKYWYLLLYFLTSILLIFFSFSTTGILGVACGLLAILLFGSFRRKLAMLLVLLITTILVMSAITTEKGKLFYNQYITKYEQQGNFNNLEAGNVRYLMAKICIREFFQSPIWGIGYGNHVLLINNELHAATGGNAHSIFSIPADLGLIGTIPFLLFWLSLYSYVFRSIRIFNKYNIDSESKILIQLSCAFSMIVLMRLLFYFHYMANATLFIFPAIIYATYKVNRYSN